jgi:hypothetical protein
MQRILRDTCVKVSYLKKTTIVITVPSKAMPNALLPPCYIAAFSVLTHIHTVHAPRENPCYEFYIRACARFCDE